MLSFEYILKDPMGLHARPAAELVKEVKKHKSFVNISFGDKTVDALRMMAVMRLTAKQGDTVTVTANGEDEKETINALERFFEDNV